MSGICQGLEISGAPLRRWHVGAAIPAGLGVAVAVLIALAGPAPAQRERFVNVYNWSDYIEPTVLDAFTRDSGIKVRYDTFDSNDTLETKLLAGKSGYDVVVPTAYFLERQIKAGVFQKLDKSKLPNLVNAWPVIARQLAAYDPGNQHSVNYMWGTVGIGYNVDKARAILGPAGRIDSWNAVFAPGELAKFKDCGVYMLDFLRRHPAGGAASLSRPRSQFHRSGRPREGRLISSPRCAPRCAEVPFFGISQRALASGRKSASWSAGRGRREAGAESGAVEAKNGVDIGYAVPKEGAQMFFDNLAIPKDARNVDKAHAFIDYLMRPDVAAKNTNFLSYANGNLASQALIDPAILNDRTIYPDEAAMARLYVINAYHDAKTTRLMNRLWTRIKTGR